MALYGKETESEDLEILDIMEPEPAQQVQEIPEEQAQKAKSRLHKYIYETWPEKPHGKLRRFAIKALEEKLAREESRKERARNPMSNSQG